jgi:hypothetical protein
MFTRMFAATLAFAVAVSCPSVFAQEQFTVNTPVKRLQLSDLQGSKLEGNDLEKKVQTLSDQEPFKSGALEYAKADTLIKHLVKKFDEQENSAATPAANPPARALPVAPGRRR